MKAVEFRNILVFVPAIVLKDSQNPLTHYAINCLDGSGADDYCPDSLVFDLEDSVPLKFKKDSMNWIYEFLQKNPNRRAEMQLVLRVNANKSLLQYEGEFELTKKMNFDAIMLPKVDNNNFAELVRLSRKKVRSIIPIIETPAAFRDMNDILKYNSDTNQTEKTKDETEFCNPRISAVVFGLDDFCAAMKVHRDNFFNDVALRSLLAQFSMIAHSYDILPIGPVFNGVRDIEGLIRENTELRDIGFRGSLCVFPKYVKHLKDIYTPKTEEYINAKKILQLLENSSRRGFGWEIYNGRKYDTADIQYCKWIVQSYENHQ